MKKLIRMIESIKEKNLQTHHKALQDIFNSISRVTILTFTLMILGHLLKAQNNNPLDSINSYFQSQGMPDSIYVKFVDSVMAQQYSISNLPDKLYIYKTIMDNETKIEKRNQISFNYYTHLMRYAASNNMPGLAIYYAEKREPYSSDFLRIRQTSFTTQSITSNMLLSNSKYIECVNLKKQNLNQIRKVISRCNVDTYHFYTLRNLSTLLLTSSVASSNLGLCDELQENVKLSAQFNSALSKNPYYYKYLSHFSANHGLILFNYHRACGTKDSARAMLSYIRALCMTPDSTEYNWKSLTMNSAVYESIDFFLEAKAVDSAAYFIDLYRNWYINPNLKSQNRHFMSQEAHLLHLKGENEKAYLLLYASKKYGDSIYSAMSTDRNNNIYSQKIAEDNYIKLLKTERGKKNILKYSIILILVLLTIIISVYLYLKKQSDKLKKQLNEFDRNSMIKIAVLEEQNKISKINEQIRLSYELHNTIANDLIIVKLNFDSLVQQFPPSNTIQEQITKLKALLESLYSRTREKSHSWHSVATKAKERLFSETVQELILSTLPRQIEADCEIDNACMSKIAPDSKIEILKIIQEAIVNILKHAKATELFIAIFDFENHLNIAISDNGIGYASKGAEKDQKRFNSLLNSVTKIQGEMNYTVNSNGTVLEIKVPYNI